MSLTPHQKINHNPKNKNKNNQNHNQTNEQLSRRQNLLEKLDGAFKSFEADNALVDGLDKFDEQAHEIISSSRAREAFDVSKESPAVAQRFGEHAFGQSCLLATRLIESGVRFATVVFCGWVF